MLPYLCRITLIYGIMATISTDDILFASATQGGRYLANIRMSGISTTGCALAELRRLIGGVFGLVQITLRNATQGWSRSISLYMDEPKPAEGVQLCLF